MDYFKSLQTLSCDWAQLPSTMYSMFFLCVCVYVICDVFLLPLFYCVVWKITKLLELIPLTNCTTFLFALILTCPVYVWSAHHCWPTARLWLSKIVQVKWDSGTSLIQPDGTAGYSAFDLRACPEQRGNGSFKTLHAVFAWCCCY